MELSQFLGNVSRRTLPYNSIKQDSATDVFQNMLSFVYGPAISQNAWKKLYLFG